MGLPLVKWSESKVNPIALSVPVLYLFFIGVLNVQWSLIALTLTALIVLITRFKLLNFRALGSFLLIAVSLYLIICQHPLLGWDTRSIWFFHSKILYFLHGSEMLNTLSRSEIAVFSHSDYPKLQPFLGALFATPFSEWREQIAKASMALLWAPVFSELFKLKNIKIKVFALFCVLVLSAGQITAGMTDWLLACYVLVSFLIYYENPDRWMDSIVYLSLPILIKAEGLVLSTLGISIILFLKSGSSIKRLKSNVLKVVLIVSVPAIAFLVWKMNCSHYAIHNYLTNDLSAAMTRLSGRLTDGGKSFWIFVDDFGYYSKVIKNMLYVALIRRVFMWQKITSFEIGVFTFCSVYLCFLFLTYLATPFDLDWHLMTSIQRTAFPILLLPLVTLVIRDIDVAKNS